MTTIFNPIVLVFVKSTGCGVVHCMGTILLKLEIDCSIPKEWVPTHACAHIHTQWKNLWYDLLRLMTEISASILKSNNAHVISYNVEKLTGTALAYYWSWLSTCRVSEKPVFKGRVIETDSAAQLENCYHWLQTRDITSFPKVPILWSYSDWTYQKVCLLSSILPLMTFLVARSLSPPNT